MDKKLSLIIQFAGVDKLTGTMKNIVGLGKTGAQSLAGMAREQRDLNRQIADYDRKLKGATGNVNALWSAQKKLLTQQEALGSRMARQKQLLAIDNRTAAMRSTGQRYVSEGRSTLMWGAMLAAPVMEMAREAGEVQALTNKLRILGLGDTAVRDLRAYAEAMNVAGSSVKDNLRYILEAQGAFRETGAHSLEEELKGARLFAPVMAKIHVAMRATGQELSDEQGRYLLRFVEQAGGMNDARRAKEIADGVFRALQSSGGNVKPADYQSFMARAGSSGMKLSSRSLFADFEPLIAELKQSAGVGLMGTYMRMNGMTKNNAANAEMLRLGLWDKNKVVLNSLGGVKSFVNGQNPLGEQRAQMLATDPVEFYRNVILPAYREKGVTDVTRENVLLFGRTGSLLFNLIDKQLPTILKSRHAYQKAQGIDQAYATSQTGFDGAMGRMGAAWSDFLVVAGTKGGLLDAFTSGLTTTTNALRSLTAFGNAHPTAFRWIGTAVVSLIGMKLALGAVKLLFGGLLGPAATLWGLWSKFRLMGGLIEALPLLSSGLGIARIAVLGLSRAFIAAGIAMMTTPVGWVIAGVAAIAAAAYLIYRNWGPISAFFRTHWTRIRNLFLAGTVIFTPFVAAIMWAASAVYRNWDRIGAATMAMVGRVRGIVGPFLAPFIQINTFLAGLAGKFFGYGAQAIWGLVKGIWSVQAQATQAILGVADRIGASFANALGIKSPSRLFMAYGGHIADGLALGIDRGARRPISASGRLAASVAGAGALAIASPPIARSGVGAVSAAPVTINITIQQQPGEDGEALAHRVADLIKRKTDAARRGSYYDA